MSHEQGGLLDTIIVVVAAIALVGTGIGLGRGGFKARRNSSEIDVTTPTGPIFVQGWTRFSQVGDVIGRGDAPVTILEFGDFQCPACGVFERGLLGSVRSRFADSVRVVFRNWPLPYHKYAYDAARAAQCAAHQGKFAAYHDSLYSRQGELGRLSYASLARDVGLPNMTAFDACMQDTARVARIEADVLAAQEVGGSGTPTIVINGTLLRGIPDSITLDAMIHDAIRKAGAED